MAEDLPHLAVFKTRKPLEAVVLVLHGGAEHGTGRVHSWKLPYLRMVPIARAVSRVGAARGIEVQLLRNRLRGWNAPHLDPIKDARWALEQIRLDHPDTPVLLVGHSMGGRVALRVADDSQVIGVCALAPWTPESEPVEAVEGKAVLIAHGTGDRITDPAGSYSFARRGEPGALRLARFEIEHEGHAMLKRFTLWNRLVCAFVLDVVGTVPSVQAWREIANSADPDSPPWTRPLGQRLRIPL